MPAPQNFADAAERPVLVLEPKPILPRLGFNPDLPADILALNLPCALYWRGENGDVEEVGYRVFDGSNVINFPRWPVPSKMQDEAYTMFETVVLPHLRKYFKLPAKDVPNVETETPPHRTDGDGSAPGDESGRQARISGARRKSRKARVLG